MTDLLTALSKTPVSIILILAGLIFLAIAILQISINIRTIKTATPTSGRQILAGVIGAIMIMSGVYLSTRSSPPESPSATDTTMPASVQVAATGAQVAATSVQVAATSIQVAAPNTSQPEIATIPPATSTLPPTPEVQTPEQFLHNYFSLLTTKKDYMAAWGLLTTRFQKKANPTGYGDYASFWKTIGQVDINNVNVTWINTRSVNCQVELTLHTVSGYKDNSIHSYYLTFDQTRNTWMFDIP